MNQQEGVIVFPKIESVVRECRACISRRLAGQTQQSAGTGGGKLRLRLRLSGGGQHALTPGGAQRRVTGEVLSESTNHLREGFKNKK